MDWDLRPTFAELAGVTLPTGAEFDGPLDRSDHPARRGAAAPVVLLRAARRGSLPAAGWGRGKARRHSPSAPIGLYDLDADAGERRDLAAEHPDLVRRAEQRSSAKRPGSPLPGR